MSVFVFYIVYSTSSINKTCLQIIWLHDYMKVNWSGWWVFVSLSLHQSCIHVSNINNLCTSLTNASQFLCLLCRTTQEWLHSTCIQSTCGYCLCNLSLDAHLKWYTVSDIYINIIIIIILYITILTLNWSLTVIHFKWLYNSTYP